MTTSTDRDVAEHRATVLVHLIDMGDPATITADEMHAVAPELSVQRWDDVLWRMGRQTHQGRLLHPVDRLDVRGPTTRWALTGQGWAAARRISGQVAA